MWNSAFGATEKYKIMLNWPFFYMFYSIAGLKIATAMVANATTIFSLVTKTFGLVATLATRFLYDLDLN